ncbi:MAG: fatty acid biosynthesis transcriptional regulator [Clostridiales bacterium]|nr:fatty acid biosynthesis transcriptional regulator [Clostridiales bacterium]
MSRILKQERHDLLKRKIKQNPFLKDEELAKACGVSVSTIRFDRAELGIAEYRERVKSVAQDSIHNTSAEILDLNPFRDGLSILVTDESMTFEGTDVVKSQYIYSFAENLALNVIEAKSMLVKVANVKYISEVHCGDKLLAKSTVMRNRGGEYIVHVFIKVNMKEVFRGKFSLRVLN